MSCTMLFLFGSKQKEECMSCAMGLCLDPQKEECMSCTMGFFGIQKRRMHELYICLGDPKQEECMSCTMGGGGVGIQKRKNA